MKVLLVLAVVALLAWHPVRAHVRAASLLQRFSTPDKGPLRGVTERPFPIPSSTQRARLYEPNGAREGAVVLIPGVHRLGVDEPRLVHLARALAAEGITILTPEVPELTEYRIEAASTESIGAAARAFHAYAGTPVGLMGMSFAGGLALLTAADPRFAPDVAFVVSVGAHDDLARVSRFFATNAIPRPDGSIAHLTAHPYGPLVLVYDRVEDFFPAEDIPAARDALRLWLWEEKARARKLAEALPPASRMRMLQLFDGDIPAIAPKLLAEIDAHADTMSAASPHGHLAGLKAPVLLCHGAGDSVIPATETLWLAQDVPRGLLEDVLISPALVHVELEGKPSWRDQWAIVHFMAEVVGRARDLSSPVNSEGSPPHT
ncbi:MAG TPA: hypothetical protein VGI39_29505 [Polyangiaceae bacterium]